MILLPAYISGMNSRKDRTWRIAVETNELSPADVSKIAEMQNTFGFLAFKKEAFTADEKEEIEGMEVEFDNGKTPSKRLYNVFYKLYMQDPEGFSTYRNYYEAKMEKIINHYKDKIKDREC